METNISDKTQNNTTKNYRYIPNNIRTSLVVSSFLAYTIMSVIVMIIAAFALAKSNMEVQTTAAKKSFLVIADTYDTASNWLAFLFLVCAIIFLFWIYRASNNTHALNKQTKIKFTPGWSVGSYFIPFLSLYWPYKSMKEIWLLSNPNEKRRKTSIILIWWWAFLFFNFSSTAVLKFSLKHPLDLKGYIAIDTLSNFFGLISALLVIKIVKEINKGQITQFDNVKTVMR